MARFSMDDGTIVDTKNAVDYWKDATDWDGRNQIHRSTGNQWTWQTLYKSKKGRYYLVYGSAWQGSLPSASYISNEEATHWLLLNELELPNGLFGLVENIVE
jgi:hypothetical protein